MIRLIRWMLDEYVRSQRIFVEWGAAAVVAYFAFQSHADPASMLATWALSIVAVSLYTTSVIADMAEQPIAQIRMLQLTHRRTALAATLCSAVLIDLSAYAILVGASYISAPTAFPHWTTWFATIPAIIVLTVTMVIVMSLLTPLVAAPLQRLAVLALIAVPMAWDRVIAALPEMLPAPIYAIAHAIATLFGVLLWPTLQLYALTVVPVYTAQSALLAGIHLLICAGLAALGFRWYARKPLAIA